MTLKLAKWCFLLLIVSLPVAQPFSLNVGGMSVLPTDVIFLFSFGFWILALVLKQAEFRTDKIFLFAGIYTLAWAISAVLSVTPGRSLLKLSGEFYLFSLALLTFNLAREPGF